MEVVDRIEDEVEAHAYEDLVPLEIKLALENQVFGWSHLTSNILGHIVYTLGSFLLAWFIVTKLHHFFHAHKHGDPHIYDDDIWFRTVRLATAGFCAVSTFRMVRRRRHVWFRAPYGSREYQRDATRRRETVRETDQKTLLGRLMRRGNEMMQRRVQRRLSNAHKMFQKRHERQKETRRKQQQLQMEEKKQKQQEVQPQATIMEDPFENQSDHCGSECDELCTQRSFCYSPCDSFCGGDYDYSLDEPTNRTELSDGSTPTTSDEEEDTLDTPLNSPYAAAGERRQLSPDSESKLGVRRRKRPRMSFHTDPTAKMESIMHDQILFQNGPILNMPYAHGGFFGAAPFMLANPHWISILRHLMPDVYVEISRRVAYAPASRLIHWAENNPVVAAYGVAHELEFKTTAKSSAVQSLATTPNLEWDVFLDPYLVAEVEVVLQERDRFLSSILPPEHYPFYEENKPLGLSLDDWLESINNAALTSPDASDGGARIELTESQRQIVKYYADQLQERAQVLVDKMLIAHGKLAHLICEIIGYGKRYNYSRVKRTRRTLGGGIYARSWMAVYAEALKLGLYDDADSVEVTSDGVKKRGPIKNASSFMSTSLETLADAICPNTSIAESVSIISSILKRRGDETIDAEFPVGLVLDIKSRHVSKRVWACVVDTLRAAGVRVVGVASFTVDEIRGISKFCSDPVMEVIFFHSAGDLQQACHAGKIGYGDKVFFNAGSLLWEGTPPGLSVAKDLLMGRGYDPEQTKRSYRILPFGRTRKMYDGERGITSGSHSQNSSPTIPSSSDWLDDGSTIELYKERYGLSLGLYCQEFAIDEKAADLIVQLINENPHVYDLGLSWGGVNGITIRGIQPGRFTSTDGFWNQRYLGALWDSTLFPPQEGPSSPLSSPPTTPTYRSGPREKQI